MTDVERMVEARSDVLDEAAAWMACGPSLFRGEVTVTLHGPPRPSQNALRQVQTSAGEGSP